MGLISDADNKHSCITIAIVAMVSIVFVHH